MQKTVEGEETSISAVLHPWFRPRFQPNHPKRPSSQVSCLMISSAQQKQRETETPIILPQGRMKKTLGRFRKFHPNHPRNVYHYDISCYQYKLFASIVKLDIAP